MKKIKSIEKLLLCGVLAIFLFSCNKENPLNAVYVTGAEHIPLASFSVKYDGDAFGLSASSTLPATQDLSVSFFFDPSLVEVYNKKNKMNYGVLPEGSCELSEQTASIKEGETKSNNIQLKIKSVDLLKEGINYLLPLKLTTASTDFPALRGSDVLYLVINRSTITKVPRLNGSNYFVVSLKEPEKYKDMSAFTLEARVSFWKRPSYVASGYGSENFMGILGFPAKNSAWLFVDGTPDRLGGEGNNPAFMIGINEWDNWFGRLGTEPQKDNVWYHVAFVFSNKKMILYIDGKRIGDADYDNAITFDKFYIGSAHGVQKGRSFSLKGSISEARFWSKALTDSELRNSLHQCAVDIESPGLEGYWKLNDGSDNIKDYTGNGNDAVKAGYGNIDWIDGVVCPE